MDSLINLIAVQITETATDPYLDAWNNNGSENANNCAWYFGTIKKSGLTKYTEVVGASKFFIQTNWDLGSTPQKCRNGY